MDENNKAKSRTVDEIVKHAAEETGKDITSEIKKSRDSFPLQTNDFGIGAMGKKYNRNDDRYAKRLPRIDRKRMIICKTRPKKKLPE